MNLKDKIIATKEANAAKKIKQYNVSDVVKLIKKGDLIIVEVDGIPVGGAVSEADANAMVETLKHFTGGRPLNRDTLMSAGSKMASVMKKAHEIAKADGEALKISTTYDIDGHTYIVDESGDVYDTDGDVVCNVKKIIDAGLDDEYVISHIKAHI